MVSNYSYITQLNLGDQPLVSFLNFGGHSVRYLWLIHWLGGLFWERKERGSECNDAIIIAWYELYSLPTPEIIRQRAVVVAVPAVTISNSHERASSSGLDPIKPVPFFLYTVTHYPRKRKKEEGGRRLVMMMMWRTHRFKKIKIHPTTPD